MVVHLDDCDYHLPQDFMARAYAEQNQQTR